MGQDFQVFDCSRLGLGFVLRSIEKHRYYNPTKKEWEQWASHCWIKNKEIFLREVFLCDVLPDDFNLQWIHY